MTTGAKGFSTLIAALVLFGLAGSAVAAIVPPFFATGTRTPGFPVFLTAGVAAILLTTGLFAYVDRLGMGFGRTALVLATGYNALIAAVKIGLAPAGMYATNQDQAFDTFGGDPNNPVYYVVVGVTVLLLYLLVFGVMYGIFKRRFRRRAGTRAQSGEPTGRGYGQAGGRGALAAVLIVVVVSIFFGLGVSGGPLLLLVALPPFSYLMYIFASFGAVIVLALLLAAVLAYKSFDEVEKRAVHLGDAALLANFFWLGLSLILLYHVMWVVFLLTLVSIWPFRTYTPK